MKKMIILCLVLFVMLGCGSTGNKDIEEPKKNKESENALESKNAVIEAEINQLRQDTDFYVGIGYGTIANDFAKAMKEAKNSAIEDLTKTIEIQVTSDLKTTLSNSSTSGLNQYDEQEEVIIDKQIRIYTDNVINNVQVDREIQDYPREGVVTVVVKKSVAEYEEEVKNKFEQNKKNIIDIIQNGYKNYAIAKFMTAIHDWKNAKDILLSVFGEIPLYADIDGDGEEENVNIFLDDKITEFYTGIQLKSTNGENFIYDSQGVIDKTPKISAVYMDDLGNRYDIAQLPLNVNIIDGKAGFPEHIETGKYGQVELQIKNIDGRHKETNFKVEIDISEIKRFDITRIEHLPTLNLFMKKIKTAAISVTFNNNGSISSPRNLTQSIRSIVISQGFAIVDFSMKKESISKMDISMVNDTNADYFLNVYISSTDGGTVGGYKNMYKATCSGTISVFALPNGNNIASEPVTVAEGFGASATDAGLNAYGKLGTDIKATIRSILTSIK